MGPFKRRLLRILQFLPLPQPPLVFTARSYGDLSSWHWNSGLGGLMWGWDPSLWKYSSQFLSTIHACGTTCSMSSQPVCLYPSYLPGWIDFFNSLLVGLPYSLMFWWFWVIVVLYFSCNFCCGCVRGRAIFTYTSILLW